MLKYCTLLCLLLAPLSTARADEIDGLDSRAIEISASLAFINPRNSREYGATFTSLDQGRPNGVTVQLRSFGLSPLCSVTLPLPAGAARLSHPAVAASGWLFVSASASREGADGWRLYATQRAAGLLPSHCSGWTNGWIELGPSVPPLASERPLASAPDAVVADGLTFVFVTDQAHQIRYRYFPVQVPGRGSRWSDWFSVSSTAERGREAWSKPAAAVYSANPEPGAGASQIHLFWFNSTRLVVHHTFYSVGAGGFMMHGGGSSRPFGDHIGPTPATTACSASPNVRRPNPLFLVCGNSRGTYSIAHYRDPLSAWNAGPAVEKVNGRDWISRSTYGGTSAPSLYSGPTFFVTFGDAYCPDRAGRPRLPGPSCFGPRVPWLIERHWMSSAATPLTGWNPTSAYTTGTPLN